MPPSKKTQNDFKRLKAKVGKRAPKPANITDTSFTSSSVQVRSQTLSHDDDSSSIKTKSINLTSSRGIPLSKLLLMLKHPSPIVRVSGLKGLQDAISNTGKEGIKMHLAVLVPNVCKCVVDEDDDVRRECLGCLRTLLHSISGGDKKSSIISTKRMEEEMLSKEEFKEGQNILQPFLPLMLAYISSSLNSLDQDVKIDGIHLLLLVTNYFKTKMKKFVNELLPPFIALLPLSLQLDAQKKKKKKRGKKKGDEKEESDGVILACFVSLLTTLNSSSSSLESSSLEIDSTSINSSALLPLLDMPDLTFLQGGVASNALLLFSSQNQQHSCGCLQNISELPFLFQDAQYAQNRTMDQSSSLSLSIDIQLAILTKLRDLYVEIIQSKSNHSSSKGLFVNSCNLQNLQKAVLGIQLFWKLYCHPTLLLRSTEKDGGEGREKLKKMGKNVHTLILQAFPILNENDTVGGSNDNKKEEKETYEVVNGLFCSVLSEMGNSLSVSLHHKEEKGEKKRVVESSTIALSSWVDKIFAHVLPRLNSSSSIQDDDGSDDENSPSVTIMKVIGQLLLKKSFKNNSENKNEYLLEKASHRLKLLITFGQAFFGLSPSSIDENNLEKTIKGTKGDTVKVSFSTCRSSVGRYAIVSLCALVAQECKSSIINHQDNTANNENGKDDKESNMASKILIQMMYALPTYLQCWGGAINIAETGLILGTLLSIVRRVKIEKNSDDKENEKDVGDCDYTMLIQHLRVSIGVLFVTEKKNKKNKRKKNKRKRDSDDNQEADDNINNIAAPSLSIFEKLPPHTQKLAISLLGMMSYPTEDVIKSLARICARCALFNSTTSAGPTTTVISNEIADYIMQVMHDMRKSMHMSSYLTFLIECIGIGGLDDDDESIATNLQKEETKDDNNSKDEQDKNHPSQKRQKLGDDIHEKDDAVENEPKDTSERASVSSLYPTTIDAARVFRRDIAIVRTCNYISRCCQTTGGGGGRNNAKKILTMLGPILSSWLENGNYHCKNKKGGTEGTTRRLSRVRAAMSILSSISMDGQFSSSSFSSFCVFEILPTMEDLLVNVIHDAFLIDAHFVTSSNDDRNTDDIEVQNEMLIRFVSPLVALMSSRTKIVNIFLDQVNNFICANNSIKDDDKLSPEASGTKAQWRTGSDNSRGKAIIRLLLLLLKQPDLSAVWRDALTSKRLVDVAKSIEAAVAKGPLDRTGGELMTEVNMLFIGCQ